MQNWVIEAGLPLLGIGTHAMGLDSSLRDGEIRAIQDAVASGVRIIDTAEVYSNGAAEELVREALKGMTEEPFLITKYFPVHMDSTSIVASCEASLRRLGASSVDLYLLHFGRDHEPMNPDWFETLDRLVAAGHIKRWGVSNYDDIDLHDVDELGYGDRIALNQIYLNLGRRVAATEAMIDRWAARGTVTMAYAPIERGSVLNAPAVRQIADELGASPAQVALAWLLARGIVAIPKASNPHHMTDNLGALKLTLLPQHEQLLDAAFPPAPEGAPFEML